MCNTGNTNTSAYSCQLWIIYEGMGSEGTGGSAWIRRTHYITAHPEKTLTVGENKSSTQVKLYQGRSFPVDQTGLPGGQRLCWKVNARSWRPPQRIKYLHFWFGLFFPYWNKFLKAESDEAIVVDRNAFGTSTSQNGQGYYGPTH